MIVVLASLPLIVPLLVVTWKTGGTGFLNLVRNALPARGQSVLHWELTVLWSAGATRLPVLVLGIVWTLASAMDVPSQWFRGWEMDKEKVSRARALMGYEYAILSWWPVPAVLLAGASALRAWTTTLDAPLWQIWFWLTLFGCLAAAAIPGLILGNSVWLFSRLTRCNRWRSAVLVMQMPFYWLGCAFIGLGLLPCSIGLAWIAIDSVR